MVQVELWVLFPLMEEGIWISSRGGRNLGQLVKELPKVSEVATNHWVFLRCDWSPVSS